MLLCGAVNAALSANFDLMIEQWSSRRKVALRGALDGQEAVRFASTSNPLLKFHGCMSRGLEETLWTHDQLVLPDVAARVESCKAWMGLNLPARDLLVVGFWTDWGYLNGVLADAVAGGTTNSITVVDPQPSNTLEQKAPVLWATLTTCHISRTSKNRAMTSSLKLGKRTQEFGPENLYALGLPLYAAEKGAAPADVPAS